MRCSPVVTTALAIQLQSQFLNRSYHCTHSIPHLVIATRSSTNQYCRYASAHYSTQTNGYGGQGSRGWIPGRIPLVETGCKALNWYWTLFPTVNQLGCEAGHPGILQCRGKDAQNNRTKCSTCSCPFSAIPPLLHTSSRPADN
jgi:hypothetical protein